MMLTLLALAAGLCAAVACWLGVELLRQNGRILARLDALETAVDGLEAGDGVDAGSGDAPRGQKATLAGSRLARNGLAAGTPAPDFRIARVGGGELSPGDFRGHPFLLVFSDPHCGPCDVLAPRLEEQSRAVGVQVVMVSRGDAEANRAKIEEYRLSFPIGLQRHWEISRLYAMFATPIAYLIDEGGIIAASVATGPDAILGLLARAAALGPSARAKPAAESVEAPS